jgi:hypothetical protein
MARVTISEVLIIMDSDVSVSNTAVTAMIGAASAIIDKIFEDDTVITEELLTELERWLTAHMIASTLNRTTSKERLGDAEVTYTGKWGERLNSTPYGQMVLTLDITGKMAKSGKAGMVMYAIPSFDE